MTTWSKPEPGIRVSDPVPHNRHPLGRLLSRLFHPLVIFIPTLVIVLKDADPLEAVGGWPSSRR